MGVSMCVCVERERERRERERERERRERERNTHTHTHTHTHTQVWLQEIRKESLRGAELSFADLTQMRTDLFYYCIRNKAVQPLLLSDGLPGLPQPFTLE